MRKIIICQKVLKLNNLRWGKLTLQLKWLQFMDMQPLMSGHKEILLHIQVTCKIRLGTTGLIIVQTDY